MSNLGTEGRGGGWEVENPKKTPWGIRYHHQTYRWVPLRFVSEMFFMGLREDLLIEEEVWRYGDTFGEEVYFTVTDKHDFCQLRRSRTWIMIKGPRTWSRSISCRRSVFFSTFNHVVVPVIGLVGWSGSKRMKKPLPPSFLPMSPPVSHLLG